LKYLTFMLADQFCGIELSCVRELLGYMPFAPLNCDHPAIVGWFDLRGQAVRVLDMRLRFGLAVTRNDDTVMIVVDSAGQRVAMLVDSVVGLEKLPMLSEMTATQVRIDPRFAIGVASVQDRKLVLIDIGRAIVIPPPLPKAA